MITTILAATLVLFVAVLATVTILFWTPIMEWIVLWLAERDLFLTTVKEAQAKIVVRYDGIDRCIMAYKDHVLAQKGQTYKMPIKKLKPTDPKELEDGAVDKKVGEEYETWVKNADGALQQKKCKLDEWDVLPADWFQIDANGNTTPPLEDGGWQKRFGGGLRWLGLPGVNTIYRYNFIWTSLEQKKEESSGKIKTVFVTKEFTGEAEKRGGNGPIDYVPLFIDTYVAQVEEADSRDGVPFNVQYLITARVVNPYKATQKVHRWLETVQNQIGGKIVDFVRDHSYTDLLDQSKTDPSKPSDSKIALELNTLLSDERHFDEFEENLGVKVDKIQIWDISPSNPKFIETVTKRFTAEQEGKANVVTATYYQQQRKLEATADEDYNRRVYGAIKEAGGMTVETAKQLKEIKGVLSLGGEAANIIVQQPQPEKEKKVEEKK